VSEHRRAPKPAPRKTAPDPTSPNRLTAALGRLLRVIRAEPKPRQPGDDEPIGNWQQRTDERLNSIEQKLASQNRLLLLSAVAIVADATIKVFKL
jgi:hypothetical protein